MAAYLRNQQPQHTMDPNERKEALTGRSHIVRLYEANASIQFPTDHDLHFRSSLSNALIRELKLPDPRTIPQRQNSPTKS